MYTIMQIKSEEDKSHVVVVVVAVVLVVVVVVAAVDAVVVVVLHTKRRTEYSFCTMSTKKRKLLTERLAHIIAAQERQKVAAAVANPRSGGSGGCRGRSYPRCYCFCEIFHTVLDRTRLVNIGSDGRDDRPRAVSDRYGCIGCNTRTL